MVASFAYFVFSNKRNRRIWYNESNGAKIMINLLAMLLILLLIIVVLNVIFDELKLAENLKRVLLLFL